MGREGEGEREGEREREAEGEAGRRGYLPAILQGDGSGLQQPHALEGGDAKLGEVGNEGGAVAPGGRRLGDRAGVASGTTGMGTIAVLAARCRS